MIAILLLEAARHAVVLGFSTNERTNEVYKHEARNVTSYHISTKSNTSRLSSY